jgi:hypothetical protein
MSYSPDQLIKMAVNYEHLATESLLATAKKKEKKKLDPKAKVRNRGTVCVPAESAKDKKDHFPINDEDQARNALARVHQYSSVPEWYKGSLKGLQALVSRKVHSKYPSIGKSDKKSKKSSFEEIDLLLSKYANFMPEARCPECGGKGLDLEHLEHKIGCDLSKKKVKSGSVKEAQTQQTPTPWFGGGIPTMFSNVNIMPPKVQQAPVAQQHKSKYPPIDKKFQAMLGVNTDGALGHITQSALDIYKKSVDNPGISNELAFEYLKREPEFATGKAMVYDDNANVYMNTRQKQKQQQAQQPQQQRQQQRKPGDFGPGF